MCDLLDDGSFKDEDQEEEKAIEEVKEEEPKKEIETKQIFLPPPNLNPINLVDFIEHNYPYFFTFSSPDDFYHLSSYKSKNNIKFSPLEFPKKNILSKIMFESINISSTAVHDDFLFAGTNEGIIHMFSCENETEVKTFKMKDLHEKIPQLKRIVSSIDVSKDGNYLIAGYENGFIALWNIPDVKLIYLITDKHTSRIVGIKFVDAVRKKYIVISSDQNGQIQKLIIEEKFFHVSVKDDSIYKDSLPTFIIELYKPFKDSNITLAALGTVEKIKLYLIEPFINLLCDFGNPDKSLIQKVPDVSFGIGVEPKIDNAGFVNQFISPDEDEVIHNVTMLAISWDKIIRIYSISIDEEGSIAMLNEGKPCGYFLNTYEISRIGFISSSIIYFFDTQKQLKIFNTALIHYGDYNPENKKAQEYSTKALIEDGNVIDPKILAEDISNKNLRQYSYRNFILGTEKSIFLLCKGAFYKGKLLNYEECINKVAGQNNWMDALCIGLDIYRGTLTSFPDIPPSDKERKAALTPFLEDVLIQYIDKTLKKDTGMTGDLNFRIKENSEIFNKTMVIAIEFSIGIKDINFLYSFILANFDAYQDRFLRNIEPFIFSDILKTEKIKEELLTGLFAAYCTRREIGLLSHLYPHLDYDSINIDFVKNVAIAQNLFTSLIYIYSNSYKRGENFIPIQKMFEYFCDEKKFVDSLNIKDFDSYTEVIKEKGVSNLEKMKSYIGHKLLWYIDMCLNGKKLCLNINDNESFDINSGHFQGLIAMIYVWILKKNVFKTLIEFDSYTFFFVITKLFSHDYLLNIIKHYDYSQLPPELVSEADMLEPKKEEETKKEESIEILKIESTLAQTPTNKPIEPKKEETKKLQYSDITLAIKLIFNMAKEYSSFFISQDMDIFIIRIASKLTDKVLSQLIVIPAVQKVLTYYKNISLLTEDQLKEDKFKCHGLNSNGNDYSDLSKVSENVKSYINETSTIIITLLSSKYNFDSSALSSLLSSCEFTHYINVKLKLLEMQKQYVDCLKVYIDNAKSIGELKIFDWINAQLVKLSINGKKENDPKFKELKSAIVDNTMKLAELSIELLIKLFDQWYVNDKKSEIIAKLEPNPEFQYRYIEKLLKDKNSQFNTIDDAFDTNTSRNPKAMTNVEIKQDLSNLLMLHFDLLIKLNKKNEILKNLQKRKNYYPIDECIKKCIDNHIVDCGIYLYKSIGDYSKAMELTLSELKKGFDELYTTKNETLIQKCKENLEQCIDVCESSHDQTSVDKQNDNLWFEILKAMYDFFNKASVLHNQIISDTISEEIESLLKKMCLYVKMKEILEFVMVNYQGSKYIEFKNLIIKILQSFLRYTKVLNSAKVLLSNSIVYNAQHFNKVRGEGRLVTLEKCDWCRRKFAKGSNESIILFQCGHKIHSKCNFKDVQKVNGEPVCMICKKNDFEKTEETEKKDETTVKAVIEAKGGCMKEKEKKEKIKQKIKHIKMLSLVDKKYLNKLEELE